MRVVRLMTSIGGRVSEDGQRAGGVPGIRRDWSYVRNESFAWCWEVITRQFVRRGAWSGLD